MQFQFPKGGPQPPTPFRSPFNPDLPNPSPFGGGLPTPDFLPGTSSPTAALGLRPLPQGGSQLDTDRFPGGFRSPAPLPRAPPMRQAIGLGAAAAAAGGAPVTATSAFTRDEPKYEDDDDDFDRPQYTAGVDMTPYATNKSDIDIDAEGSIPDYIA